MVSVKVVIMIYNKTKPSKGMVRINRASSSHAHGPPESDIGHGITVVLFLQMSKFKENIETISWWVGMPIQLSKCGTFAPASWYAPLTIASVSMRWALWNLDFLKILFFQQKSAVTSLQYGGKFIVTSSDDGTVKLWNAETGKHIRDLVSLESRRNGGVVWRIKGFFT